MDVDGIIKHLEEGDGKLSIVSSLQRAHALAVPPAAFTCCMAPTHIHPLLYTVTHTIGYDTNPLLQFKDCRERKGRGEGGGCRERERESEREGRREDTCW